MAPRKRDHAEMAAADSPSDRSEPSLLDRIRNMSEFAALMQYLFLFGKAVKADEMEVEVRRDLMVWCPPADMGPQDFEQECLLPTSSEKISELGLALLKVVSSHRGLTYAFTEYIPPFC